MIKRLLDLIVSIVMLCMFMPIIISITCLIYIKLGKPIFFKQIRPGLLGKPFTIIKFRTMFDEIDSSGDLVADSKRMTRFGQFLRSTSVDELPELWNVLKGEMSLVGPRPLLSEYLPLYSVEQKRRHDVRPGITGWAQVNGRNAIDWEKKFELDVWYVDNQSLLLDVKIFFLSIKKVFMREGINAESEATMYKFKGNRE